MTPLSETRKADRKLMSGLVLEQALRLGSKAHIDELFSDPSREVWVCIEAPGGLQLTVDFDGKSCQPNTHVLSWHMSLNSERKLDPAYWPNLNTCHFRKATDIAEGFEELTEVLEKRLADAVIGVVYQPEEAADGKC